MGATIIPPFSIKAGGTTTENEPIIKSDGAGAVTQWLASTGDRNITFDESSANALSLVVENTEHATQTEFTQGLTKAGLIIETAYTDPSFQGGLFWRTSDNNVTKPKGGIYLKEASAGTSMYFGTSSAFGTGINNDAIIINPTGTVTIAGPITIGSLDIGHGLGGDTDSTAVGKDALDGSHSGSAGNTAIGTNALGATLTATASWVPW